MITVLCLPGTSETSLDDVDTTPSGMCKNVTDQLDPARFTCVELPYSASYGYPDAYGDSRDQAVAAVLEYVADHPTEKIVLLGYSQGAVVVGRASNLLRKAGNTQIVGVGLIADGERHRDQGRRTNGYGIVKERYVTDDRWPVWTMVADGDPICNLPKDNALRWIGDMSEFMGRDLRRWFLDLSMKTTSRGFQEWNGLNPAAWFGAVEYAQNYLTRGRHTVAYVKDGHCDELAAYINTVEE